ncbi:MAG: 30S ribosomal protein S4 [Oligoflexia bacterium]|nr:30S ribosomal protein S4 [Oligoflexia bacterium]MBF0366098.1 30S ribosomal protein S4 [Oligoflexia bacterium]
MGRARFKIQRRLGLELPGLGKAGALERRPYPPGQHGMKRKKLSDYSVRLNEKQKVIFHYGLREAQLRNYVRRAKKCRSRTWVEVLVMNLESRIDNVVFRLNFSPSIAAARQMVLHGHILVNGKKVTHPAVPIKTGDKISLTTTGYQTENYKHSKEKPRMVTPAFLLKDAESGNEFGRMVSSPDPKDIPFAFDGQLLTEFYWKV